MRRLLLASLAFTLAASSGCRRQKTEDPKTEQTPGASTAADAPTAPGVAVPTNTATDDTGRFALEVVAAARTDAGIGPDLVDADLVERIRRVQLVKRALMDSWDPKPLLAAFHGETGPDRQYPVELRPQKQRERATRGLKAALAGTCKASAWPKGLEPRVKFLTDVPDAKLPDEIKAGLGDLKKRLAGAELARVQCQKGQVALLIVKDPAGKRRLVDAFNLVRSTIEVNPNEPTMK